MNTDKAIEIEDNGYQKEIDFAQQAGYNDVVDELIELRENRRRELRGESDFE